MKKILLTITSLVVTLFAMAQAPNLLNYQGVARNAAGNVLPNQSIGLRLTILNGSASGTQVYQETRTLLTNAFGLFNVQVGSPGFTSQTGTIAGVNWTAFGAGSGNKFLQVELDPNGGSSYVSVGTTQMLSVPYALYAAAGAPVGPAGGDLTGTYPNPQIFFPLVKTFNFPTTQLIGMTNSSTTGTLGAITGASASQDPNAMAVSGTISSTSPGGFSAALRGTNNGTGGLGIGVYGSQNGSGWGVYGVTPTGIGVIGSNTGASGFGVYGQSANGVGVYGISSVSNAGWFQNTNSANTADILAVTTNGTGNGFSSINTGTGRGGFFQVNNAASTANALEASTNGTGASWAIRGNSSGTNGAAIFVQSNLTNTANNVFSNQAGLGRAGLFQTTNTANTADVLTATTNTNDPTPSAVHGINGASGITVVAKKGGWGESDNGVGVFGSSSTGVGVFGVSNTGAAGVSGFTFGTGAAVSGSSLGGRAADFNLATPNNSTVVNAATTGNGTVVNATTSGNGVVVNASKTGTGTGVTAAIDNANAANLSNTLRVTNSNISSVGFGNGSAYIQRGTPSPVNNYLFVNVPTAATGIVELGIGVQGSSSTQYAVSGVTNNGIGLVGYAVNAAGYGLATVGQVQFSGQGAAANRIWGATNAAGDATWRTAASLNLVSGSGTLNYVPKWTPDGVTLGNSIMFDNGGGVGVGTITPAYRLDVVHGGSTGIRSQSTSGFSVVDIDATSGDAALRFQKSGVGLWNTRNDPANDGYQWFELGGGGERMRIQRGTGNVGINESAPGYKLQVTHGGSTGILSKSTSGFSVMDIDAQSGDAALRFYANGTGQWNMRNRPADNYLEWFELGGGGSRMVIQDGTGNVGIGETTNPTYRLDVLHGGSTGIRSRSSSSFSVVDIDGASGDAALRFQKAGVNMWNTRNRPADDYYEWFEFGGGGSRMVIQRGTGNVGIGETTSPSYKLDVLHGGATGIRSRSSSSFSVVDIDAASGDAALRFQKAGVGMWNTRNRPADDYYEIFELGGGGSRMVIQDGTGNVGIGETTNPTYRLDVLHGGATGARVRSTSTFSIIDIDAANGDAALRFAKAGVNQWNIRNRPADDYLEIFELGGGGSRVVIQDGTGNVGIGETTNPTYRLDVLHGGATGIRSRSSSTFSLVDIDAANGDAALRFAKAGVNQWNMRNDPANDNLQIFELGGGGERLRIENGTGTIRVGMTGGAFAVGSGNDWGALTVVQNGNSGVALGGGANTGSEIKFDDFGGRHYSIYNTASTLTFANTSALAQTNTAGTAYMTLSGAGNLNVVGNVSKGGGSFKIDHPLDPANKYLYHSFVESPDMMNIYNGNIVTDASGKASVQLPDYFNALNKEYRYQLTVIGSFAQAIVSKEVANNQFEIATNQPNVKVSWQVTGIRQDAYANQNRIPNTVEKETYNKGRYLHPTAFGQPETKSVLMTPPNAEIKTAPVNKPVQVDVKGTSLEQLPVQKPTNKAIDNGGSVAPQPAQQKVDKKVQEMVGSIVQTEASKIPNKVEVDQNSSVGTAKELKTTAKTVAENNTNSTNSGLKLAPTGNTENLNNRSGSLGDVIPVKAVPAEPTKAQIVEARNNQNTESVITRLGGVPAPMGTNLTAPVNTENAPSLKMPETKVDNSKTVKMEEVPQSVANPTTPKPVANLQGEKGSKKD